MSTKTVDRSTDRLPAHLLLVLPVPIGAADPLADFQLLEKARSAAAAGDRKAAAEAARQITPPAPACDVEPLIFIEARRLLADSLEPTDPAAAAAALLELPDSGETIARAIHLLESAQRPTQEAEARLLTRVPESPEARSHAKKLGAAGVAKRLGSQRALRVYALLDAHKNDAAAREAAALLKALPADHKDVCRLRFTEGKALRKLRKYSAAIQALEKARAACAKDASYLPKAALLLTHVRGIRRQVAGTKEIADWFAKSLPEHSYADDAMLVYARVLERRGKHKAADKVFRRIIDELGNGDEAPAAAWRLAFAAYEKGKLDEAKALLEWILEKDVHRPIDHARARYWLARITERKGEDASKLFARVVAEPSFYAWLALDHLSKANEKLFQKLTEDLQAAAKEQTGAAPKSALTSMVEWTRSEKLAAANETELATAELSRLSCRELSASDALALALAFDRLGAHPEAQRVLRSRKKTLLAKPLVAADTPIWRTAYSRAFFDEVLAAAATEKLEPLFLLALVREESTFDPTIVSWAGATGLAQLMPSTAIGAYANVYKKRLRDLDRLTDPELNLRLGAHVLKDGLRKWGGLEPLALSAYNGGHGLTARIVPKKPQPFELWVERISVKETRRYVKRVIETWGIYRLLYDDERPFVELPRTIGG